MRTPRNLVLVSIVGFVTWTTTADPIGAAAGHAALQSDECDQDFPIAGAPDPTATVAAVFAPHPDDSVPTSVATGPDSAYYVGELTGFPPVAGAANVYRVPRSGEPPEVCVSGFTMIMDIAFDPTGNLYVLEFPGSLVRVTPSGTVSEPNGAATCGRYATGQRTTLVSGLTNPTSIAVGPDNGLYVSNRGTGLSGQVIRFER